MTQPSHGFPLAGFASAAVFIGASTGGPAVVEQIVRALPADFPAPVAVCQHMPNGDFVKRWAERLNPLCWLQVKEAEDGEPFAKGTVYIAPPGKHLQVVKSGKNVHVKLVRDYPGALFTPSIDCLMSSAAETFGSRALGVLMTGLGADGAHGLLALRQAGAYTIVERPESAVASSMPAAASDLGAAVESVTTGDLPKVIVARAAGVL